jgi:transcriptional regulator with XRE-family HTH domain
VTEFVKGEVSYDVAGIGTRIKTVREERGLSQSDLDRLAGVGRASTERIEGGEAEVSFVVLAMLAVALDLNMNWLVGRDAPMHWHKLPRKSS